MNFFEFKIQIGILRSFGAATQILEFGILEEFWIVHNHGQHLLLPILRAEDTFTHPTKSLLLVFKVPSLRFQS